MAVMKQLVEHEGVMIEVEYELDGNEDVLGPNIISSRVLDGDYRATGPDLTPLLHKMAFMTSPDAATKFLSMVADELAQ